MALKEYFVRDLVIDDEYGIIDYINLSVKKHYTIKEWKNKNRSLYLYYNILKIRSFYFIINSIFEKKFST